MLLNRLRTVLIGLTLPGVLPLSLAQPSAAGEASYVPAVRTFADNVLKYGRDTYGPKHTPLLADGVNVDTHEPAVWKLPAEQVESWKMPPTWILSNLATQQNLFRVLVSLSAVTGDPRYRQAAVDSTRYAFDHLDAGNGLLFWGGHAAWDLASDQPVGEGRTKGVAGRHELKCTYPFYELMWEVDPEATKRFIEAFWSSHILRWDILDMNRHGTYEPIIDRLWEHEYVGGPVPFTGNGLTFMNTGADMFYAAALLYELSGDERPLTWGKRMARRYVEVRDPDTGLGADNYSVLTSHRIQRQFEAEFGDRFTEATVTSLYNVRYSRAAICQFKLAERLGPAGVDFGRWAVEDLAAWARHAYDPADHSFWATLRDGTRLSPADIKQPGYVEARWLEKRPANGMHLWAYVLAWKFSGDAGMWQMARGIAEGLGLGDMGPMPRAHATPPDTAASATAINLDTAFADTDTVFALLDLHAATQRPEYLALARRIGDNLLAREFHHGFFVADADHLFCRFDTVTPLALLYIEAASRRLPVKLPSFAAGKSYFHCPYDGVGRTYDHRTVYTQLRERAAR